MISKTPVRMTNSGTSTSKDRRPVWRKMESVLAKMKKGPMTTVTLSIPPITKVSSPTTARPSVQIQLMLGAIPRVDNSQPLPTVISKIGINSVLLSEVIGCSARSQDSIGCILSAARGMVVVVSLGCNTTNSEQTETTFCLF